MANRVIDNLLAFRILKMLVTPFKDTEAFKLGIVDEKGKNLKRASQLKTFPEKDAYNYLTRLVFNLKRLINKLPGGESKLRNVVAAYFLVKETYTNKTPHSAKQLQEKLDNLIDLMDNGVILAEELNTVQQFFSEAVEEDVPANVTGAGVSTDQPVVRMKRGRKFATYNVGDDVFKKFKKGKKKYRRWNEYLNLEDETQHEIYKFARRNPRGVIVLKNGEMTKAIRFNRNGGGKWGKITRGKKYDDIEVTVD